MFWTSATGEASCVGNCFDASTYGLNAEASQFISAGTRTIIQIDGLDEWLEATVRHCRKHGAWFRIGLQLKISLPPVFRRACGERLRD